MEFAAILRYNQQCLNAVERVQASLLCISVTFCKFTHEHILTINGALSIKADASGEYFSCPAKEMKDYCGFQSDVQQIFLFGKFYTLCTSCANEQKLVLIAGEIQLKCAMPLNHEVEVHTHRMCNIQSSWDHCHPMRIHISVIHD